MAEIPCLADVGGLFAFAATAGRDDQLWLEAGNFVIKSIEAETGFFGFEFEKALAKRFEGERVLVSEMIGDGPDSRLQCIEAFAVRAVERFEEFIGG